MSEEIKPMTLDRFRQLIDAYGAESGRWPEQDRDLAVDFLTSSPEAQTLLEEVSALDSALDSLPKPELSTGFRESVLNLQDPPRSELSTGLRESVLNLHSMPMPVAANENEGILATMVRWYPQSNSSWFRAAAASVTFGILCGVGVSQLFNPPSTVVVVQPALPEFVQPVSAEPQQGGVATLTLIGTPPTISLDPPSQNEEIEPETADDSDVPLT